MGTSKSNSGLRRNTPLLPDYAPPPNSDDSPRPPDDEADGDTEPTSGDWSNAKAALTAVTKANSGGDRRKRMTAAARTYVSGSGGSRRLQQSSIGGRQVGRNLGRILFTITSNGVDSALAEEGLSNLIGQRTEIVFAMLANQLSSNGGTVEETIANIAVVEALSFLYEEFNLDSNDLTTLDSLTEDQANEVIQVYISTYIFERWIHELGRKIEDSELSESQVVELEDEIREFIQQSVKLNFRDVPLKSMKFDRGNDKKTIDEIFKQAYKMLE